MLIVDLLTNTHGIKGILCISTLYYDFSLIKKYCFSPLLSAPIVIEWLII